MKNCDASGFVFQNVNIFLFVELYRVLQKNRWAIADRCLKKYPCHHAATIWTSYSRWLTLTASAIAAGQLHIAAVYTKVADLHQISSIEKGYRKALQYAQFLVTKAPKNR